MSDETNTNPLAAWMQSGDALRGCTEQAKNVQAYFADLQQRYAKTVQEQITLMASSNEQIARALQSFAACKQPQDFVEAETRFVTALFEVGERSAKQWVEFARDAQAAWSDTISKAPGAA